jgi:hypothetical protein
MGGGKMLVINAVRVEFAKEKTQTADAKSKTEWTKYKVHNDKYAGKKVKVKWSEYVENEYKYERYVLPDGKCYRTFQDGSKYEEKTVTNKIAAGSDGDVNVWFFSGESHRVYKETIRKVKKYVFEKNVKETDKKPPSDAINIKVKYREA